MASKLSDRELRRRALKLSDPYDQPDLISEIPAGVDLVDIFNIYEYELWPAAKVYCAKCGGHHHKNGFTAFLTNGKRILLGSKCGADAFGESWHAAAKRMDELFQRQYELDRLDRLSPILKPMSDALSTWAIRADRLVSRRLGFEKSLGELASRAREAAIVHDGALTVVRQVQSNASFRQGGGKALDAVTATVGQMRGKALFSFVDVRSAITKAEADVEQITGTITKTDLLSTSILKRNRRAIESSFERLVTVAQIYEGGQEFFAAENLRELVIWANNYRITEERYHFDGDVVSDDNGTRLYQLPRGYLPDLPCDVLELINEYRRSD